MLLSRLFWSMLISLLCISQQTAHARLLVTSTQPLYLIAQAVTTGIEQPRLLIPAHQDGHHAQLKPQDRRLIQAADFVLWIGPEYEATLTPLLSDQANAIALTKLATFRRLPQRGLQGQAQPNSLDPHLWLDPYNAIGMAHAIATIRGQQYPRDATAYLNNARQFSQRMIQVLRQSKIPTPQPYWAYHDAYQYLEKSLGLQFAGALTRDHELPPTAQQLQWLKQNRPSQQPCLFAEAHAQPSVLQHLAPIQQVTLDERMTHSTDFIAGWQTLQQQISGCQSVRQTN